MVVSVVPSVVVSIGTITVVVSAVVVSVVVISVMISVVVSAVVVSVVVSIVVMGDIAVVSVGTGGRTGSDLLTMDHEKPNSSVNPA